MINLIVVIIHKQIIALYTLTFHNAMLIILVKLEVGEKLSELEENEESN